MTSTLLMLRQVRYENRAFWRTPESAFFTFALPVIFMIIINLVFATALDDGTGSIIDFYTPALIAFAIVNVGFTSVAMTIAIARDEGLLKRIHGTPLPTPAYLGARVIFSLLIGLLLAAIVAVFGAIFFGVELPLDSMLAVLFVLILGTASFAALGVAAGGLIPSSQAAPAVVNGIVLPLLFISNVFIRVEDDLLVTVSRLFPVRHFADALQAAYHPDIAGPIDPFDLAFVAGWGIAGLIVAWRTFSWEPRS